MLENDLPCLDLLEATPEILRGLMREISDDDARWNPASDRFSIAEVLAHLPLGGPLLPHAGGSLPRRRDSFFEADDAQVYLDLYRDADPEDSFRGRAFGLFDQGITECSTVDVLNYMIWYLFRAQKRGPGWTVIKEVIVWVS
jgi:hypothetical protein